jgi:hypothetical protein
MTTATVPAILPDDSPRVRRSDPITSHEAADSNNLAESSAVVLALMRLNAPMGMADWEIFHDHQLEGGKYTEQRLRTARHELVESGQIEDSGDTTVTMRGRKCTVWRLTEAGR